MVETKFNKDDKILETNYLGYVSRDELVDYIDTTKLNSALPRTLKIISDTRDGLFNFSIEDLGKIVEANNQSLEHYDAIIDAIIVDDPKNTVLTVLFQQLSNKNNYKFDIFATKAAALNWLQKW